STAWHVRRNVSWSSLPGQEPCHSSYVWRRQSTRRPASAASASSVDRASPTSSDVCAKKSASLIVLQPPPPTRNAPPHRHIPFSVALLAGPSIWCRLRRR